MDKKNVIIGVIFLLGSAYCAFSLFTKDFQSSTLTGLIVFAFIGLAFIRRKNER